MRKIIFAAAVAAMFVGCAKDSTNDVHTSNSGLHPTEIAGIFETVRPQLGDDGREVLWKIDDRIGVFTDLDSNVPFTLKPEYDGKREGRFAGSLSDGASVAYAYYPYSASAGNTPSAVAVTVAATQNGSADFAANDLAVASTDANGVLVFRSKAAMLRLTLKNIDGSMLGGKYVESIRIAVSGRDLTGDFLLDATDPEAALTAVKTQPAATLSFADAPAASASVEGLLMVNPVIAAGDDIRISVLADGIWYGYTAAAKQALAAGKRYDMAIDCSMCGYVLAAEWAYGGAGVLTSFLSHTPAIDGEGNVYVTTSNSSDLLKISPDGQLLWQKQVGLSTTQNTSPSLEADGSTVYACGGNATNSRIRAFAADGTEKWVFTSDKFFGNGSSPSPNFNQMVPAVGDECIYIGNAGTTGSVLSIDKATGERRAYVSGKTDGTTGPAGGVASGMALSSEGVVAWFCNYGLFGANASLLDNPTQTHATYGGYVPFGRRYGYSWAWKNSNSAVACMTIDGVNCIAAAGIEGTPSGTFNLHVYAAPADGCLESNAPGASQAWKFDHKITGVKQQDQGGIVVGPRGELIVSLKNNGGDGGVYAVAADGQKAWQFKCGADVAGAAAVDAAGNVHIAADNGTYYIIRPNYDDGSFTTIASAKVFDLVREAGYDVGEATAARLWTSVMIGDDGAVYLGCEFHTGWQNRHGVLVKLSYGGCTGAGNTPWPMKYADCRHSCVQKTVE